MNSKIKQYFIFLINLPLYYISCFIPKNKDVWIFGAWFGNKYADNSKALFEYVNKHDKKIKAIWLTKDKNIIIQLQKLKLKVYHTYSLKGYYYSAIAKFTFVSTDINDINQFVSAKSIKVQLWHGTPLKKIMHDSNKVTKNKWRHFLKRLILPISTRKYQYLLSPSEKINKKLFSAFRIENIIVQGYPRNDILFNNNKEQIITFLPTHRGKGNGKIQNLFNSFNSTKINAFLKEKGYKLLIKPHYYDLQNIKIEETKHINIVKNDIDLYSLLSKTTILITDYSSVYFDFLLLDRPILFTPFDIKEYINKDRELYYNYDEVTPGPKCKNWDEVMSEIEIALNGQDNYRADRERVTNYFNHYKDGNSSKRVYRFFKKLD